MSRSSQQAGGGTLSTLRARFSSKRNRHFSAIAWQGGVELIEYRESRDHTTMIRHTRRLTTLTTPDELANCLADMVEAEGGRGGDLSLGLRGFGTVHRIVTLPVAEPAILGPIVERDLRRFDPLLERPLAGFVPLRRHTDDAAPRQDLLAAAVPEALVDVLERALSERRVTLRYLTVLPRAVQRIYHAFHDSPEPAVVLWLLPGSPVVAAFDAGHLRLLRDPPTTAETTIEHTIAVSTQLIDRAVLFLRQQFGGAPVRRLLVAGSASEVEALEAAIPEEWKLDVSPLTGDAASPGALAALGVALDASGTEQLNLMPMRTSAAKAAPSASRAVVAAAVIMLAAAAWALTGIVSEVRTGRAVERAETIAAAQLTAVDPLLPIVRERQAHLDRVRLLDRVHRGTREVGALLTEIEATTPPALRIDSLTVAAAADGLGWQVMLNGTSTAWSSAEAMQSVNQIYRGVQQRLPLSGFSLDRLESFPPPADGGSIAVRFAMSFIVASE